MTKDEALKLALEALEKCDSALAIELDAWDIDPPLHHVLVASNACGPAITAIKEALAQQQEPVAWMYPDDYEHMTTSETFCTVYSVEVGRATRGESIVALYTSPPAKPWVGLTDEDKAELDEKYGDDTLAHLDAVEAKLKEKNT